MFSTRKSDTTKDKGLTDKIYRFLTEPTATKSQREDYYQSSSYIAEYRCTLSNVGLFAVGVYYNDASTLLAATFSALSHAIPLQRLHDLDIIGVAGVLLKAIRYYALICKRDDVLITGAIALSLNALDTLITRKHRDKVGSNLHVAWHLAATVALATLNQAILDEEAVKQFKL